MTASPVPRCTEATFARMVGGKSGVVPVTGTFSRSCKVSTRYCGVCVAIYDGFARAALYGGHVCQNGRRKIRGRSSDRDILEILQSVHTILRRLRRDL